MRTSTIKQSKSLAFVNNQRNYGLTNCFRFVRLGLILTFCLHLIVFCCFGILPVDGLHKNSADEVVTLQGWDVEFYRLAYHNTTLSIYRLINPLANKDELFKTPVIFHHGINFDQTHMMSNSDKARPRKPDPNVRLTLHSVENGTDDRGLHFYLSNNNYDVWLLEGRGVNGTFNHNINFHQFWDFSIDDQALLDLPAMFEFVLAKTNQTKAAYVAFSQSTTFMFALLSFNPDFADKVEVFIAMAPVVYTSSVKGLMRLVGNIVPIRIANTIKAPIYSPRLMNLMNNFFTLLCSPRVIKYTVCRLYWQLKAGPDKTSLLENQITRHAFVTTSMKTLIQFMTNAQLQDFRMFDYMYEDINMEHYGQPQPPRYIIERIKLKTIVLFRGTSDFLSDLRDQSRLISKLTVPLYEDHLLYNYAHLDFLISPTVSVDINEPICRILDKLTGRNLTKISYSLINPKNQIDPKDEKEFLLNLTLRNAERFVSPSYDWSISPN